jgi:hypothetical protein
MLDVLSLIGKPSTRSAINTIRSNRSFADFITCISFWSNKAGAFYTKHQKTGKTSNKPPFQAGARRIPRMRCYSLVDQSPRGIGQIFIIAFPIDESFMNDLIGLIGSVGWRAKLTIDRLGRYKRGHRNGRRTRFEAYSELFRHKCRSQKFRNPADMKIPFSDDR